ncbi:MBL fold metallo-hydrolase [Clostridium botulinum]|uniref:Hydroxyacylglutathione hydrolase n=1 Tax=Clostridium botulinum C/D str. DC5 TaxID=1443128 RepID=A0A0A0ID84_CLOBO|nr:MBL fold metallo-hydrolase [Clostridium botulinum]KGM98493.1 hydroxyacylglutathione hydrolase [Clostridium botulinum C/D str. DC5]KOC51846.1 hydroxyacylglutathione hydrolase [Clostridium botulinum]KOC53594.1 hydroxyacylglutathione hydrolase [Clostridium botulinum]MCD3234861.1 MBL fold metallo-hydrolase [Clostridium botulinum D/C]MCD3240760.1 MBL fold metallo-hydrolase [Clostridium botulinum D/C]
MEVTRIVLGAYATNCYIVQGEKEHECILIDPADNADYLISYLEDKELAPMGIILTHEHYDHILAVPGLQEKYPYLKVYCHPMAVSNELYEYDMGVRYPTVKAFKNIQLLEDNQVLKLTGIKFTVMYTPGHSPGSIVLQGEDVLFTGDTLFKGSIGRTDFKGGNMLQMISSLKKIMNLPIKDSTIFPGHNAISNLEWEKKYNSYLDG